MGICSACLTNNPQKVIVFFVAFCVKFGSFSALRFSAAAFRVGFKRYLTAAPLFVPSLKTCRY